MAGNHASASPMDRVTSYHWTAALITLVLTLSACAPSPGPSAGSAPRPAAQVAPEPPRVTRTLVVGSGRPIDNLSNMGVRDAEVRDLVNASVTNKDLTTFQWYGWLAQELPSIERGTLQIHSDGSMTSTWKMRSGIKWHDGTPFVHGTSSSPWRSPGIRTCPSRSGPSLT